MKTMKHKYNTTLSLSVFPPSPVSNTILNTANNYSKCFWHKRNSESQKKKFNFPWFASAHPECTGLEGKTSSAQQKISENSFKKKFFKDGIIHSIAENTKLWLCRAVRLKQCLFNLEKKNCHLRFKPVQ